MSIGIQSRVQEFASRLRFPRLFGITLAVLVVDLLVPDLIPFVDEILLALATALLGSWKRRRTPPPR
ncbi:MAG TPA: DUF6116 family protein [Candidatus Krumholzibacteria bacterium]|nr:DUF6116 family protein [Candidatus Krumholzibacteria bacterium]